VSCSNRDLRRAPAQHDIGVGYSVRVRDTYGEEEYTLVRRGESDVSRGLVSVESPLGSALLGRRLSDSITVRTPDGVRLPTIVEVAAPAGWLSQARTCSSTHDHNACTEENGGEGGAMGGTPQWMSAPTRLVPSDGAQPTSGQAVLMASALFLDDREHGGQIARAETPG
jgi:hypothetical protein